LTLIGLQTNDLNDRAVGKLMQKIKELRHKELSDLRLNYAFTCEKEYDENFFEYIRGIGHKRMTLSGV
jgi:hypothetical protein